MPVLEDFRNPIETGEGMIRGQRKREWEGESLRKVDASSGHGERAKKKTDFKLCPVRGRA